MCSPKQLWSLGLHAGYNPRANGAKRRSGRKPGARVTNTELYLIYLEIGL